MTGIPDHLAKGLRVLFIGFNPSIRSGESGHHYANPTNRFWKLLHLSGLVPRRLHPEEDDLLVQFGYGLTNIVGKPTQAASDLTKEDYQVGRALLLKKLKLYQPKMACYVGKGVYEQMLEKKKPIPWGKQPNPVLEGTVDFVVPSSSGLVRMPFDEILNIYKDLKEELDQIEH